MVLLGLVLVPLLVGAGAYLLGKRQVTLAEAGVQVIVVAALMLVGYYVAQWSSLQDYEIWNGRIASKSSGAEVCCHTYECNCREVCRGSGLDRRCSRSCDRCTMHDQDLFWRATSTNREIVYESRCNAPESGEPAEWAAIRVGEPTAWEHQFTNYVKAAPEDFFVAPEVAERFTAELPAYPRPQGFRARRFLFAGVEEPRAGELDAALAELNADLGPVKQVNVIVVVTASADPLYFDALARHWLGGKKNDVVLVLGAPRYPAIAWARVMAWNEARVAEDAFKDALASRIEGLGRFDGERVLAALRAEISESYRRRPFGELEHLGARATPPGWAVAALYGAALLLSAGLQTYFWRNRWRR